MLFTLPEDLGSMAGDLKDDENETVWQWGLVARVLLSVAGLVVLMVLSHLVG